ncbi:SulP family inorganic anion transporter [Zavarzinia sp.]|uniref:SulP family inorganic anion transporter n=1 Tax=Zavarzinia sp. TaxID=2027920 RepID=UPI0035612E64
MPPVLRRLLPCLDWAAHYRRDDFAADAVAAIVVTIMLVPQSLAYALLAGLPPYIGLYASILPLIAYAVFGTSRTMAVGPVAVISLMTASAIGPVVAGGTAGYLAAALVLALESGLILLAMGLLRLGFLANFISHSVISGFLTASGVLIATSQIKHILGVKAAGDTLPSLLEGLAATVGGTNGITVAVGLAALGFLYWARRRLKFLLRRLGLSPRVADILAKTGPVLAVAVSTLVVAALSLDQAGVKVVGAIPAGLPPLTLPVFDPVLWLRLLVPSLLIALVGFVESVSIAHTLGARRRDRIDADAELVALGVSNLAAGLTGGYPVTGGLTRSVVNHEAGAETQFAGVMTAGGIVVAMLWLTSLFEKLPQAVLAAIIILAVIPLIDIAALKRAFAYSKADFAAMVVTIVTVLFEGVEAGITAGAALSILLFLYRTSRPHMAIVGRVPGTEHYRNVERHAVITSDTVLTVRVDESLYFANARYLEDRIYDLVTSRPKVAHVVLQCSAVNLIDASALESLEAIDARLRDAGVTFHLSEVKGPVMDRLKRSDFLRHLSGRVFLSQAEAMAALDPATLDVAKPVAVTA